MCESATRLVVLSGEAGAGKDAVARILVEEHGWVSHSLSGPMKRFMADLMGFTDDQLYGASKFRNEPDPRWARPCDRCEGTGNNYARKELSDEVYVIPSGCPFCEGTGKINDNSPRRILQLMGEEFLRQMVHPDVLTMRAAPEIEDLLRQGRGVVVNDARNPNDRDNLHRWLGGHRVAVRTNRVKPITGDNAWRLHASEQRQAEDKDLEYVLHQEDDRWPFPDLPGKVEAMLRELQLL